MDGTADEEDTGLHGEVDDELVMPGGERDSLDDEAASDLEIGEHGVTPDAADQEPGALRDEPEHALDVGALHDGLVEEEEDEERGGDDDAGPTAEDEGDDFDAADDDDGGAEGFDDGDDAEVDDEDLPALDGEAGAEEERDDLELFARVGEDDHDLPPWDRARWSPREPAVRVPCRAIATHRGVVAAAGEALFLVDDGGHAARRVQAGAQATTVAMSDGALFFANRRGQLLRSDDVGATATAVPGFRAAEGARITLVATPGRVWVLTGGSLSRVAVAGASSLESIRSSGIRTIAAGGGTVLALSDAKLERLRADDLGWDHVALAGEADEIARAGRALLATDGAGRGAVADAMRVALFDETGQTLRVEALAGVVAIAFAREAELLALVAPARSGAVALARIAGGGATRLADLGADADDDEPLDPGDAALVWDSSRDVAWIVWPRGLVAVGPSRHH